MQIVGLPDLDTGLEIKNVQSAKSENTISKHIGKEKRKQGYRQIVIDVSENPSISDEEARGMIASSLRRRSYRYGGTRPFSTRIIPHRGVAEQADVPASEAGGRRPVRVRIPPPRP